MAAADRTCFICSSTPELNESLTLNHDTVSVMCQVLEISESDIVSTKTTLGRAGFCAECFGVFQKIDDVNKLICEDKIVIQRKLKKSCEQRRYQLDSVGIPFGAIDALRNKIVRELKSTARLATLTKPLSCIWSTVKTEVNSNGQSEALVVQRNISASEPNFNSSSHLEDMEIAAADRTCFICSSTDATSPQFDGFVTVNQDTVSVMCQVLEITETDIASTKATLERAGFCAECFEEFQKIDNLNKIIHEDTVGLQGKLKRNCEQRQNQLESLEIPFGPLDALRHKIVRELKSTARLAMLTKPLSCTPSIVTTVRTEVNGPETVPEANASSSSHLADQTFDVSSQAQDMSVADPIIRGGNSVLDSCFRALANSRVARSNRYRRSSNNSESDETGTQRTRQGRIIPHSQLPESVRKQISFTKNLDSREAPIMITLDDSEDEMDSTSTADNENSAPQLSKPIDGAPQTPQPSNTSDGAPHQSKPIDGAPQPSNGNDGAPQPSNTNDEAPQSSNDNGGTLQPLNTNNRAPQPPNTNDEVPQPPKTNNTAAQPSNTGNWAHQPSNTNDGEPQPSNNNRAPQPSNTNDETPQSSNDNDGTLQPSNTNDGAPQASNENDGEPQPSRTNDVDSIFTSLNSTPEPFKTDGRVSSTCTTEVSTPQPFEYHDFQESASNCGTDPLEVCQTFFNQDYMFQTPGRCSNVDDNEGPAVNESADSPHPSSSRYLNPLNWEVSSNLQFGSKRSLPSPFTVQLPFKKPRKTWTDDEVQKMLKYIERSKINGNFEKPTKDEYYETMIQDLQLSHCTVSNVNSKLYRLKKKYNPQVNQDGYLVEPPYNQDGYLVEPPDNQERHFIDPPGNLDGYLIEPQLNQEGYYLIDAHGNPWNPTN